VHPAGSDGPPPNADIALVAEDAAYRIAVDAGCEPLASPTDKPKGQRVAMCATLSAGRALHAAVDKPARVATELPLSRWSSVRPRARSLSQRTTSSSAGPRSAGYCSVCDCERVRVPASTALAVAARPPRGRQGERPAFAAAGVSADERAGDLLSAEVRTLPCESASPPTAQRPRQTRAWPTAGGAQSRRAGAAATRSGRCGWSS
jgi:hypothetical protein